MGDPLEITRNPGDALERTHPPQQFRCDAHEAFTMAVENRLTRVETRLDNVDKSIEKLDATMRSGVNEIKAQLLTYQQHEVSQNVKLAEVKGVQLSRVRASDTFIQVLKILAPIIGAIITGAAGASWLMSCNGGVP